MFIDVLGEYLAGPQAYVLVFVLGAIFGSFANVCIYRWPPTKEHPTGRSVVSPGSHCSSCGGAIPWYDNIPIVSFLWLRGRCRACKTGFSCRYVIVEILTAVLFLAVYLLATSSIFGVQHPGEQLTRFGIYAAFVFVLVVITFIDFDHMLILNKVTYPAIPIFYGLGLLLPERGIWDGVIGAAVGYGVVRLISDGYYYLFKREGMGYGDGKLLAIIGALFGWQGVFVSLTLGCIAGVMVSVPLLLLTRSQGQSSGGRDSDESEAAQVPPAENGETEADIPDSMRHVEIPFGPYLALGAVLYLFVPSWFELVIGG